MLNNALKILTCILLIVLIIGGGNAFHNFRLLTQEARATLQNAKNVSARGESYIDFQLDLLQSDAYQKSIKASLDTGAVYNSTGRLLNTQVLPRVMKDLDRLDGLIAALTENSVTLTAFIADTNKSVNQFLLPQATALLASLTEDANRFGITVETLNTTLTMIANKSGMTLDEIYNLASSAEWKSALRNVDTITSNLASTTRHVDASAASIEEAMKSTPSIAKSLERIASTSSRYQKILLIVGILSTIGKAFLP